MSTLTLGSLSFASAEDAKVSEFESDLYEIKESNGKTHNDVFDRKLWMMSKKIADIYLRQVPSETLKAVTSTVTSTERNTTRHLDVLVSDTADKIEDAFFRGRYDRSRARSPENIDAWRSQPDIANPGVDLANFPNSAFTLPEGRAYIEMSPLTYYGPAKGQGPQFNSEFLLRYGLTDSIEARVYGNGATWQGASTTYRGHAPSAFGFSPIAFDTKIHLMDAHDDQYLPAIGLEAYVQTSYLGNAAFNQGTTPGVTLNFDQSLPFDIDFEYNLGAAEQVDAYGTKAWQFIFQWALQRDLMDKYLAVFVHGYYNAMNLPRLPQQQTVSYQDIGSAPTQNAVGAGFLWTPNNRVAFWAQSAGGTGAYSPSVISNIGFAVAF